MRRVWSVPALLAAAAIALAGCGFSDDDAGTTAGSAGATTAGTSTSSAVPAEVAERVDTLLTRPTEIGLDTQLDAPVPKGKTIYLIQPTFPASVAAGDALQEAADALGWKLVRVNAGATNETIKKAWDQVANTNPTPDGVVAMGFDRSVFAKELKTLASKGVPVIDMASGNTAGDGLTAVLGSAQTRPVAIGKILADWTIADSDGKADTLYVEIPALSSQPIQRKAFEAEYKAQCPSCKLKVLEEPVETIGTTLPSALVSAMQSNPDATHMVLGFGDLALGLPAAMKGAGVGEDLRIVTDSIVPAEAEYIANDTPLVAATIWPGDEFMWEAVDVILRSMNDKPLPDGLAEWSPNWIVTKDTLPSSTDAFPVVADYQDQFKALWGVQ
jgi:ribose transport system substrate-binding protein